MQSFAEAMEYLNHFLIFGKKQGLDGLRFFLRFFGSPEQRLRFIHLAGTNGKGSTAATLAAILAVYGLRTGLYTSPYIHHFTERIRVLTKQEIQWSAQHKAVAGEITTSEFIALLQEIRARLPEIQDAWLQNHEEAWYPTYFEILTGLAFIYYARQNCDVVVLETGLGGLLDSTNVVAHPDLCLITALNYDHCEYLGYTMAEIALQKAGILKEGVPCLLYSPFAAQLSESEAQAADQVVATQARRLGCPLHVLHAEDVQVDSLSLNGQHLFLHVPWQTSPLYLTTPLLGEHQGMNVGMAVRAAHYFLQKQGVAADAIAEAVQVGVASTYWPVRLEVLSKHPPVLVDGAHNLQGVQVLAKTLADLRLVRPIVLCGFLENKEYTSMFTCLFNAGIVPRKIYCVTPNEPRRALPATQVAEKLRTLAVVQDKQIPIEVQENVADVWRAFSNEVALAQQHETAMICFGSLYLAGPFKEAVQAGRDMV